MNLLKDEVSLLVRKLAVPASVGTLFQTLYTIVDTFYAGKISPEALSALSKSFPIYFLIIATSIGVTVAGTSLIGSSIGEKNEKNVLSYFGNVIIYSIIPNLRKPGRSARPAKPGRGPASRARRAGSYPEPANSACASIRPQNRRQHREIAGEFELEDPSDGRSDVGPSLWIRRSHQ